MGIAEGWEWLKASGEKRRRRKSKAEWEQGRRETAQFQEANSLGDGRGCVRSDRPRLTGTTNDFEKARQVASRGFDPTRPVLRRA